MRNPRAKNRGYGAVTGPMGRDRPVKTRGTQGPGAMPVLSPAVLERLQAAAATDVGRIIRGDPIWLTASFWPLAANAQDAVTIPIQSDSDVILTHVVGTIGETATKEGGNLADVELNIESGRGERYWQDGAMRGDMFVGDAQDPGYLVAPVRMRLNDVLTIRAQNLTADAQYLNITFHGFRMFDGPELVYPRWPFYHRLEPPQMAAAGAAGDRQSDSFTVRTSGPFAWSRIVGYSEEDRAFAWRCSETGEGRSYSNGRTAANAIQPFLHRAATIRGIEEAYELDWPAVFSPLSDVEFEVINRAADVNNVVLYAVGIYLGDALDGANPAEILEALAATGVGL